MAGARGVRTYVLDTSVLLSDPWAITRFAEHSVVLPLVVISELEGKRHHPELGWFAREALRALDELRLRHGRLDAPVPVGTSGGTLHVELNHTDPQVLPAGFRTDSNDSRILACALNLAAEGHRVTLVTKDMTGQQIKNALEQQWQPDGLERPFLKLGVSDGFAYTYDPSKGRGERGSHDVGPEVLVLDVDQPAGAGERP